MNRRRTGTTDHRPLSAAVAAVASVLLLAGCSAGQAVTPAADEPSQVESGPVVNDGEARTEGIGEDSTDAGTDDVGLDQEPTAPDASTMEPADSPGSLISSESAPDYANDAGQDINEYDYPDDPPPAESIVATLCNLNQDYIASFRTMEDGVPVVDDNLRTMLVAFSDYLSYWDSLRPHYPEAVASIDTAQEIYDLWDQAMLDRDNGDLDAAQSAMLEAEKLLDQLPTGDMSDCTTG